MARILRTKNAMTALGTFAPSFLRWLLHCGWHSSSYALFFSRLFVVLLPSWPRPRLESLLFSVSQLHSLGCATVSWRLSSLVFTHCSPSPFLLLRNCKLLPHSHHIHLPLHYITRSPDTTQGATVSQHVELSAVAQALESPAAIRLATSVAAVHITGDNQLRDSAQQPQPVPSDVAHNNTTMTTSSSHKSPTPCSQPIIIASKARRDSLAPALRVTKAPTPTAKECIEAQKRAREARALQVEECRRARAAEEEARQERARQAEERRAMEQERQRQVAQQEEEERRAGQGRKRERQVEEEKAAAEKARAEQAAEDDAFLEEFYAQFTAAIDVAGPITLKRIELETKRREQAFLAQVKFGIAPRECRRLQFAAWSDPTPASSASIPVEDRVPPVTKPAALSSLAGQTEPCELQASPSTIVLPTSPAPYQLAPFADHLPVPVGAPLPSSTLPQGLAPVDVLAAQERALVEEGCRLLEQMASQASRIAWDEMVVLEAWRRRRAHQAQQVFGISPRIVRAGQLPSWSNTSLVPEGEDEWARHMLALSAAYDEVCTPMPALCPPTFVPTTTADSLDHGLTQRASCDMAPIVPSADDVPALSYSFQTASGSTSSSPSVSPATPSATLPSLEPEEGPVNDDDDLLFIVTSSPQLGAQVTLALAPTECKEGPIYPRPEARSPGASRVVRHERRSARTVDSPRHAVRSVSRRPPVAISRLVRKYAEMGMDVEDVLFRVWLETELRNVVRESGRA
ncbi:hypothetical protein BOTBODRAFT_588347 [Botryobasidium botryosum FD-172 SS1]|uniref:Uncharacterized protein n=1 Tax=Botryobasidium botryosum (strain FD-172 SS1) TaxID=930990 RepID=A0A067LXJ4_BOTB1|nr:hypothetical protein BOTBODRAFT_588347 [Botryobasidium botryosum FD-172 SS1]